MKQPRLSASAFERYSLAPSSWIAEWEYFNFCEEHQLSGMQEGEDATEGTNLHELLSHIPFQSDKHRYGSGMRFRVTDKVNEVAEKLNMPLSNEDYWLCVNCIERRNKSIDHAISHVMEREGRIADMSIEQDERRMYMPEMNLDFAGGVSGLADVNVTIHASNGAKYGVILDYKTGRDDVKPARENHQIQCLTALKSYDTQGLKGSFGGIISRANKHEGTRMVYFDEPAINKACNSVHKLADRLNEYYVAYTQAGNTITPELHDTLVEKSQFGKHLKYSEGKVFDPVVHATIQNFYEYINQNEFLSEYKNIMNRHKETWLNEGMDTMEKEEFENTLGKLQYLSDQFELLDKTLKEGKELAVQLAEVEDIGEGVDIKTGALRTPVKKDFDARRVHSVLSNSGIIDMPLEDFVAQTSKMQDSQLKRVIAENAGIKQKDVVDYLKSNMSPEDMPMEKRHNKPSAVISPVEIEYQNGAQYDPENEALKF